MRRDMDRRRTMVAEPYSDDDTRPTRAETDADQWHRAWDDDGPHVGRHGPWRRRGPTGWGYLPRHAPIYVGPDGAPMTTIPLPVDARHDRRTTPPTTPRDAPRRLHRPPRTRRPLTFVREFGGFERDGMDGAGRTVRRRQGEQ